MTVALSKEVEVDFPAGTMRLFLRGNVQMTLTKAEFEALRAYLKAEWPNGEARIRDLAEGDQ